MKHKREPIWKKCGGRCGYCGQEIERKDMTVDHIIPQEFFKITIANRVHVPDFLLHLGENDVNHYDNLMPSCRRCNNYKSAYHLHEFRYEISQQLERLEKKSVNFTLAKRFGMLNEIKVPEIIFYFEKLQKVNSEEYLITMEKYHLVQKALIEENLKQLSEKRQNLETEIRQINYGMDDSNDKLMRNNLELDEIKKQLEKFGEKVD